MAICYIVVITEILRFNHFALIYKIFKVVGKKWNLFQIQILKFKEVFNGYFIEPIEIVIEVVGF